MLRPCDCRARLTLLEFGDSLPGSTLAGSACNYGESERYSKPREIKQKLPDTPTHSLLSHTELFPMDAPHASTHLPVSYETECTPKNFQSLP